MVAAAGAGVAAVEHEFLGAQARLARFLVERKRVGAKCVPVCRRMNIDFNHAGIGGDVEHGEARVRYRAIAFDTHTKRKVFCHAFYDSDQVEIIFGAFKGRQKDVQAFVAHLDAECCAHDFTRRRLFDVAFCMTLFFSDGMRIVQIAAFLEGIAREFRFDVLGQPFGQRRERQTVA